MTMINNERKSPILTRIARNVNILILALNSCATHNPSTKYLPLHPCCCLIKWLTHLKLSEDCKNDIKTVQKVRTVASIVLGRHGSPPFEKVCSTHWSKCVCACMCSCAYLCIYHVVYLKRKSSRPSDCFDLVKHTKTCHLQCYNLKRTTAKNVCVDYTGPIQ